MVMTHLISYKTLLVCVYLCCYPRLLGLIVQCMTSLSLHMSCFFFNLCLPGAIICVPNVFLFSMFKMPLDTFLYLTIDEGNQMGYAMIGGSG